ncbi:MAG: hypothetical protein HFH72_08695 [Lachnospiraceae bacterium]|nr:hypothetical protein [Lachnospiraceae bacterium]
MEIQCCATCKYGHCEKGKCVCMTDSDYIPHDVEPKNKCDDYASRNRETYIRKIASELQQEFLLDGKLYSALVASIESAIKELPPCIDEDCAARRIADRIVGREEK